MTRSRTAKEGSVGLLALLSMVLFGGLIVWLRGGNFGRDSYEIVVEFSDAYGVQTGSALRYRGVPIGRVIGIAPSSNGVAIKMEITDTKLTIPSRVTISTNRSGFIGEAFVDIVPLVTLPESIATMSPVGSECDSTRIICDGDRLTGETSVSFEQLLNIYGDPKFLADLSNTLENTSKAATDASKLSKELMLLSTSFRQELRTLSGSANTLFRSADLTSGQIRNLTGNIDTLVGENRANLARTLNSISQTSEELESLATQLYPTLDKVNSTLSSTDTERLVENIEIFTDNAANASASLLALSNSLNNPSNLLILQQTLDSARATFENTRKITADLDDLTGDPAFRTNLRRLVDGLSKLISHSDRLEGLQSARAAVLEEEQNFMFSSLVLLEEVGTTPSTFGRFLGNNLNKESISTQNSQTPLSQNFQIETENDEKLKFKKISQISF